MNKKINKLRLFLLDLPKDIKLIISLAVDTFLDSRIKPNEKFCKKEN